MYNDTRGAIKDILLASEKNGGSLTYKDVSVLRNFINEQGKIIPRRITGIKAKQQKKITKLVKQARIAALLPFVIGKT